MALLRVDIDTRQVESLLQRLLVEAEDPSTILDEAAAIMINRTRQRFLAETDPDGKDWIESAAAKKRRATGVDGGTLFDTGNLFRSIQAFSNNPRERAIGTDVEYGKFHQLGQGQIQRQFLGFSDEDVDLIELLFTTRLLEAIGAT